MAQARASGLSHPHRPGAPQRDRYLPPLVAYPVRRPAWVLTLGALWLALTAAALLAWWWGAQPPDWQGAWAALLTLAVASLAWDQWRQLPQGRLIWNGREWRWLASSPAGKSGAARSVESLMCRWATGSVWLIRIELGPTPPSRRPVFCWVLLERHRAPGHWLAVRRALVYHQRHDGPGAHTVDSHGRPDAAASHP